MPEDRRPMIENSDRGVTLSKPLAWMIFVAVVSAVWTGATTIAGLANSTDAVVKALSVTQLHTSQMEARIRAVEIAQASQTSDLRSIQLGITEIKSALSDMRPTP